MNPTAMDFDDLFIKHERVRWSPLTDIPPLSEVDPSKVNDQLIDDLIVLAKAEFSSIPAIIDLLRIFRGNDDLTAWLSIWFAEEVRHHLVLRQWATASGRDPASMIPETREPELGAPSPVATLAVNVLGEIRTCWLYAAMAAATDEPVLSVLLRKIAGDEGRHAQGFAHYACRIVDRDPHSRAVVLRVGQIWYDPASHLRYANPAAENYQSPDVAADIAELYTRYVDVEREAHAVATIFSDICGLDITGPNQFGDLLETVTAGAR